MHPINRHLVILYIFLPGIFATTLLVRVLACLTTVDLAHRQSALWTTNSKTTENNATFE